MLQLYRLALLSLTLAICLHIFTVSSKELGGIHLKFTAYNGPPYDNLKLNPDGNYSLTGSNANIIEWLSKKLNFTYSIADPVIDPVLIAKYGYYDLAIDKLGKNGIDGLLAAIIINYERAQKADFTSTIWSEPYTIVAPKPEQKNRLFAFIRPFQAIVWLYLAVSSVLIVTIMSLFSFIFKHQLNKFDVKVSQREHVKRNHISKAEECTNTIGYYIVYAVNILTNHGIYSPYVQHSFRILAAGWLLAALVLVNSYSSIVVSSLTVPTMKPAVNTLEDLANNKDISIILSIDVVLSKTILNATTGILKSLGDQAREIPKDRVQLNSFSLVKKLETSHYGYPFIESFNRNFIGQQYKKDGKCRFRMSPPLQFSSGHCCFLLRKGFPCTSTLSWGLAHLWETGLVRYWVINLIPKAEECFDRKRQRKSVSIQKASSIKLQDLASAFLILGIGIGLGILSYLVERIIKR